MYSNYKRRLRTEQSGFLYGDALMAVTLVLLILPIILYVLSSTLSIVKTCFINQSQVVIMQKENKKITCSNFGQGEQATQFRV